MNERAIRKNVKAVEFVEDAVTEGLVGAFCSRVYGGMRLDEAAQACGQPLVLFQGKRHESSSLNGAFEFAEKREGSSVSLSSAMGGVFRGPVEIKTLFANEVFGTTGLFEKVLTWMRRIDPDGDEEDFDDKIRFILKNRVFDQFLPRTSAQEINTNNKVDTDTRTQEQIEEEFEKAMDRYMETKKQVDEVEELMESNTQRMLGDVEEE